MEREDEKSAFQYFVCQLFFSFLSHFFLYRWYFSMFCFWVKYTLRYRQRIILEILNLPAPKARFASSTVNSNILKTSLLVNMQWIIWFYCKLICSVIDQLICGLMEHALPLNTTFLRFSIAALALNKRTKMEQLKHTEIFKHMELLMSFHNKTL